MIRAAIAQLVQGDDLTTEQAAGVMDQIMTGEATPAQIGAYLSALRSTGGSAGGIVGSARVMRQMATPIGVDDPLVVDTCGTGGDGANTFNISTTVAFVVAGGGITVAKHGNRAVSSKAGSADVLKSLGVNVDADTEVVSRCVNEIGIGFLFAPRLHGAMKHAIGPRREVGIRTLFNVLGPLTNPAGANYQVLGVYDPALTDVLAAVLLQLGTQHCFVVHGSDGLDEITTTGPTRIAEGKAGVVEGYHITPDELGLVTATAADLVGGDAEENAAITRAVLAGAPGPQRDIVLANAAPMFVATGKVATLKEGVQAAGAVIDSGAAADKLAQLVQMSQA